MASITKRGGTYKITVSSGSNGSGRQVRHYMTWKPEKGMTEKQTAKALQKAVYEFEKSIESGFCHDNRITFSEYADYYVKLTESRGAKAQTLNSYQLRAKRVAPYIGEIRLVDLRPAHINAMYLDLVKAGAKKTEAIAYPIDGIHDIIAGAGLGRDVAAGCGIGIMTLNRIKRGERCKESTARKIEKYLKRGGLFRIEPNEGKLKSATVAGIHVFVRAVLSQAEKEMIIEYNPASRANVPRVNDPVTKEKYLQPEDLQRFMDALQNEPIRSRTMFTLLAVTGCRRGELLALKWSKVDFLNKRLLIDSSLITIPKKGTFEGTTKTGKSRVIAFSEDIARLLLAYKVWHDGERIKWGDLWENSEYIFTTEKGGTLNANSINSILSIICENNGIPHINPHMFRHTAASILISKGVDVLTVSKVLGHSNTTTTLNVYGHEIDEAKNNALMCLTDEILPKSHLQNAKKVVK